MTFRLFQPSFLSLLLVLLVLLISFPTWEGTFFFDDHPNIVQNQELIINDLSFSSLISASLSGQASSIGRPVSMLTFALNNYFKGMTPFAFKVTNTLVHIMNTLLVFFLSLKLLQLPVFTQRLNASKQQQLKLSFMIALIWAITPSNMHSAVYIVQRMNSLAFLFTLSACLFYLRVRLQTNIKASQQALNFIIISILIMLSVLSKENGALTVPLLFLIEFFIYKSCIHKDNYTSILFAPQKNLFLSLFFWLLLALPAVLVVYYSATHYQGLLNYSFRDFTLEERAFTQLRIVFSYLSQLVFPDIHWLNYGPDDFPKSYSLINPITTLYTLLFWLSLFTVSLLTIKKWPWLLFGVLWFYIGHSIESTILPLEMMFFHRNYLPSFGIIFLIVLSLYASYRQINRLSLKKLFWVLISVYLLFLCTFSYLNSVILGNTYGMIRFNMQNHPNSLRAQQTWAYENFNWYLDSPDKPIHLETALKYYKIAHQLKPDHIAVLSNLVLIKHHINEDFQNDLKQLYKILAEVKGSNQLLIDIGKFVENNLKISAHLPRKITDQYFKILFNSPKISSQDKVYLYQTYAHYIKRLNKKQSQLDK